MMAPQKDPWNVAEPYTRRTHFVKMTKKIREIVEDVQLNRALVQGQLELFDSKIRGILEGQDVYADLHHQYLAYARALDKSQRTMAFMVDLRREWGILRERFERRNLKTEILDLIDQFVIYRTGDL